MLLLTKEEAQTLKQYWVVSDPYGSQCYPKRYSTQKEALNEASTSNISGDLVVHKVDVINQKLVQVR